MVDYCKTDEKCFSFDLLNPCHWDSGYSIRHGSGYGGIINWAQDDGSVDYYACCVLRKAVDEPCGKWYKKPIMDLTTIPASNCFSFVIIQNNIEVVHSHPSERYYFYYRKEKV